MPNAITWRASAERSPKRDKRQRSSVGSWPSRPGAHPLGVATHLAIAAATGLLTLQTLAAAFHLSRGETTDLWLHQ